MEIGRIDIKTVQDYTGRYYSLCKACKSIKKTSEFSTYRKEICSDCIDEYERKLKIQSEDTYNKENATKQIAKFRRQYPEKAEAWKAIQGLPKVKGHHLHHWSYNPEHYMDIILLTKGDHYKLHRFIQYDPRTKMYKDKASNYLLDNKRHHAAFISLILEHY